MLRHLRRRRLLQQLERHGHRQLGCDVTRVPVQCSHLDTRVVTAWVDVQLITCRPSSFVLAAVCSWVDVQPVICSPRCSRLDFCALPSWMGIVVFISRPSLLSPPLLNRTVQLLVCCLSPGLLCVLLFTGRKFSQSPVVPDVLAWTPSCATQFSLHCYIADRLFGLSSLVNTHKHSLFSRHFLLLLLSLIGGNSIELFYSQPPLIPTSQPPPPPPPPPIQATD